MKMAEVSSKKRYFKKEKKQLKPKRHKAKSEAQLKAAGKKGLRRGIQVVEQVEKKEKRQKQPPMLQFPNISRFITEGFENVTLGSFFELSAFGKFSRKYVRRAKKKNFWMSILLVGSLVFAGFLGWKLWDTYAKWHQMQGEYVKMRKELTVWENVTREYPTYRDAYFEAAVLAYRLGEKNKEGVFLQKALDIDPNFQPAIELQRLSK